MCNTEKTKEKVLTQIKVSEEQQKGEGERDNLTHVDVLFFQYVCTLVARAEGR